MTTDIDEVKAELASLRRVIFLTIPTAEAAKTRDPETIEGWINARVKDKVSVYGLPMIVSRCEYNFSRQPGVPADLKSVVSQLQDAGCVIKTAEGQWG